MLKEKIFKKKIDGEEFIFELSDLAMQSDGAVITRGGGTVVLSTVVVKKEPSPTNFLPLVVDFEERYYASGEILGSRFIKREGRPSEEAILSARIIDRSIRPLIDQRIRQEIQIVNTVFSYKDKNPTLLGLLGSSLALLVSGVSFKGPVAGFEFKQDKENISAFFAGTKDLINMIEFEGKEISLEKIVSLFEKAQLKIKELIDFQNDVLVQVGSKKQEIIIEEPSPDFKERVISFLKHKIENALYQENKKERSDLLKKIFQDLIVHLGIEKESKEFDFAQGIFDEEVEKVLRKNILEKEKRPDGRELDEIRPLFAKTSFLPQVHGSAIFCRGETHILSTTTLDTPYQQQVIETMKEKSKKRFFLHYNFPPYCVGEAGRMGPPSRREIGHGALAEKALKNLIPSLEQFPYTIRVVNEVLCSNGSSSMGSVCASSLSLMDSGVPLQRPVVGIALGLITNNQQLTTDNYKILTDIQGPEDHYGDMDFKITSTRKGVTAIQMDVKIEGINKTIFQQILCQAEKNNSTILDLIEKILPQPRSLSPLAVKILFVKVPQEKIGEIIGPGGRMIQSIITRSGSKDTKIDIEDDGSVFISGPDANSLDKAKRIILAMVRDYQVGEIVKGKVVKIFPFGAVIDLGGKEGFVHISELSNSYVKNISNILKLGQDVKAKVIKIEPEGKISLSLNFE